MTDYLNDFVQESEQSITELNNALLDLENSPDDEAAMDQVFRTAHTLKGNCGAMGFDAASDLAHAIEDLLDAIRAGSLEVSPELMDLVFDGVDNLEAMIDEVDEHGETRSDPSDAIEALRSRIEEDTGLTKPGHETIARILSEDAVVRPGHDVYHARVSLKETEASGLVALDALEDAFDLLGVDPDPDAIRAGDHDGTVDVVFGSAVDEAAIAAALDPVKAVEDAIITEAPDDLLDDGETGTRADDGAPDEDPSEMEVDSLLDEFEEYDDLDEAVDRVDDVPGLEEMGEAGAFDDIVEEDVTPAYEETGAEAEAAEAAPGVDEAEEGEVEDAMSEFQDLQEEYDRVGLDQMEEELEGVEFGEFDEEDEVGFDELLGDELEEPGEPAEATGATEAESAGAGADPAEATEAESAEAGADPAEPTEAESAGAGAEPAAGGAEAGEVGFEDIDTVEEVEPGGEIEPVEVSTPDESAIEAAVEAADAPPEGARAVFLVRLGVGDRPGENNGHRVVAALQDAFDLLGTVPDEDAVVAGEYDESIDAVFASQIGETEIRSALRPVEEVTDTAITEVTDRFGEPAEAPEADAAASDATEADAAAGEADAAGAAAGGEEVEDPMSEFQDLQSEYDRVGLDQMEQELEEVEFGEFDEEEEVGFDELLGEEFEEVEPAEATEAPVDGEFEPVEAYESPTVEPLSEDEIAEVLAAVPPQADTDRDVFHARLGVVEQSEFNNGIRVLEALRDAFDILEVRPSEEAIRAGEYEESIDALFGSHVGESEIHSALDPVEEVSDVALAEVTDRMPAPEPADAGADAGTAGAGGEDVEDPMSEFQDLQDEYDRVGIDQMEQELEGVEFGEFDEAEEVGFDELLGEAAEAPETAGAAEAGADAEPAEGPDEGVAEAGEEFGDVEVGTADFGDVEAGEEFGDVEAGEAGEEFGDVEAGEAGEEFAEAEGFGGTDLDEAGAEFGEAEVDESAYETADAGAEFEAEPADSETSASFEAGDDFGDVEVGDASEFGDVEVGDAGDVGVEEPQPDLPEAATESVDTIKGIGTQYASRLADVDVETVADLLSADVDDLSSRTDISASRIGEWRERAPVDPSAVGAEPAEPEPEPEPETPEREMDEIQSVRVDVDRIDELLNLVEEMVTSRARLRRAIDEDAPREVLDDELEEMEFVSGEIQDAVLDMRLVPLRTVTQRLPRVVRDISRDQGKRVNFEVSGEGVEVDRSILNQLGDPLIHLVRNAVDHGIEPPEERTAKDKPEEGSVEVRARRTRDVIEVEVVDDGRGLDPDDLREKAVEDGVMTEPEAESLSDEEAYGLIFRSGFSTTEEVTDVSGRGVGMDVVRATVDELDGDVEVESELGEGTTVRLTLPVSVAISEVLFVESGGEEYGVPITVVDEIGAMGMAETVATDGGRRMIRTDDGRERELIDLHDALETPRESANGDGMLVTVEDDVRECAIHCDHVRGQQEVVVKPFEGLLSGIPGLSGAAVLGEGDVVNILDVETL